MTGPLEGIRVLDFSRHLAGPFAGMTLGDLGADVIKVEAPGRGDDTRSFPPYWNGESCYFMSTNRNKRSVTIDLQTEQGKEIARKLAAESDILLHNFRTGTPEKLGIGYEQLKEVNDRLIYCTISAVGSDGPDKDRAGVDLLMQAYGGLMSITGEEGRPPVRVGTSLVDLTCGANAVQGILAALYFRERTGQGQKVESSLLEGQVSWMTYHAVSYFASGEVPQRRGSSHGSVAPYGAFATRDGFLVVAVVNDGLWKRFCGALDREELIEDPRFSTNPERCANAEVLQHELEATLVQDVAESWAAKMDDAGVPCSPVNSLDTVLSLPQVLHREMVVDIEHPGIPDLKMPGIPIKLSETHGTVRMPPPLLGQHTDEILGAIGYAIDDVTELRNAGVI
jgi:crotonobetainyl-CoA:carnitine CoA-transferase CaiB-like acyl-CoA transferase